MTTNPSFFNRTCLLSLFILVNSCLIAQPSLLLDTIFLENTSIERVRSSFNGELWLLSKSPKQLYRLKRDGILQNRSNDFLTQLASGITDFVCPDTNALVLGTNDSYACYYNNGVFENIGINNGIQSDEKRINSIFLKKDVIKQYGNTLRNSTILGIATDGQAYWNDSITGEYLPIGGYSNFDNRKFLSRNDHFMMNIPKPHLYNPFGSWNDYIDFDPTEYGDVLCGNANFYASGSLLNSWLGFQKGYVTRTWSGYSRYLTEQNIYAIVDFDDNYVIIAADSGLYYSNTWQDPHKIDLGIGNFTAFDVEVWQGTVFVASNIGLLKLINSDCAEFHLIFDQDKQYTDIEQSEEVTFEPVLYGGTKSCLWQFDDGTESIILFPVHYFSEPGNYEIRLIASNGVCTDTTYGLVTAYAGSKVAESAFDKYDSIAGNDYAYTSEMLCIADLDGDSHSDLLFPQNAILKLSNNDTLVIEPREWNPEVIPEGTYFNTGIFNCLIGDMNNDGLNEIIAGTRIFINRGSFNFQVMQYDEEINFLQLPVHCLLDYDNDGKLDIALGYESKLAVYLNRGSFTFEKIWLNIPEYSGSISGIKWFDLDNDNDNDLIVSGITGNNFFINNNGHYNPQEYAELSGILIDYIYPADLNNDLRIDLYLRSGYENYLFLGDADSLKQCDATWLTNERNPFNFNSQYSAFGATFEDFDNNGHIDCLKNTYENYSSRLYMNYGNMILRNNEHNPLSISSSNYFKTIASSDISNDGKVDILLDHTDYFNKNDFIFLNKTRSDHNWIKFQLYGSRSNINAIGTKAFIKTSNDGLNSGQYRFIESDHSDHAQNGYEVHFGLGDADVVDTLEILWTSGHKSIYTNLEANKTYEIIESLIRYSGDTIVCANTNPLFQLPHANSVDYKWFRDGIPVGTDNELRIIEPGAYKCIIYYPDFTDTTEQINIYHKEVTSSFIYFDGDSIVCPGDSVLISSAEIPGASYKWLINGIIDPNNYLHQYYASDSLPVQQILVNNLGCSDSSQVLALSFYPLPEIDPGEPVDICEGDSMVVSVDSTFSEYLWSNGDTTYSTVMYAEDSLSVLVWNEFNCKSEVTIPGFLRPLPYIDLGPDTVIGYNEILFVGSCNSNPYTYFWNDSVDACYRNFSGEELNIGQHQFSLLITSEYNCRSYDTVNIEVVLNRENEALNEEDLYVFPNPSDGHFNLYINEKLIGTETVIEIFNSIGTLVDKKIVNVDAPRVIAYTFSSNGTYFLRIIQKGNSKVERIHIY